MCSSDLGLARASGASSAVARGSRGGGPGGGAGDLDQDGHSEGQGWGMGEQHTRRRSAVSAAATPAPGPQVPVQPFHIEASGVGGRQLIVLQPGGSHQPELLPEHLEDSSAPELLEEGSDAPLDSTQEDLEEETPQFPNSSQDDEVLEDWVE